jgi:hypothetical protein
MIHETAIQHGEHHEPNKATAPDISWKCMEQQLNRKE